MEKEKIQFLKKYRNFCLEYGYQILGFDDGAFVMELTNDEIKYKILLYTEKKYDDGSVGMSGLKFASQHEIEELKKGEHSLKTI